MSRKEVSQYEFPGAIMLRSLSFSMTMLCLAVDSMYTNFSFDGCSGAKLGFDSHSLGLFPPYNSKDFVVQARFRDKRHS